MTDRFENDVVKFRIDVARLRRDVAVYLGLGRAGLSSCLGLQGVHVRARLRVRRCLTRSAWPRLLFLLDLWDADLWDFDFWDVDLG